MCVGGVGSLVLGVFGPVPASAGMGIIGNTLVFASFAMSWETMRRFNGGPPANGRVAILIVAFLVIFSTARYLGADVRLRAVLISLAVTPLAFLASREIVLGGRKEPLSSRTPTAIIFGAIGVDMLLRAIDAGFSPPVIPELAFFDDPIQSDLVFAMTIGLVCLSVSGLSMMEQERQLKRQEKAALTDVLTQLPNRRFFDEQGGRLIKRASINGKPACILVMDLDRFARINERFGHAGGDQALAAFADFAARAYPADRSRRALRRRRVLRASGRHRHDGGRADRPTPARSRRRSGRRSARAADKLHVSVGLAALQGDDLGGSIERADQALYQAKREGRDRVAVATSGSGHV